MSRYAPTSSVPSIGPRELVGIMQAALVDPTHPSTVIHSCTMLDHRQRDGQRGATQYEVEISDTDEGDRSKHLVTALSLGGNRTRRLWRQIGQMHFPRVVPESGLRPFAYVPDLDILFQVFPFDARLQDLHHLVPEVSPEIASALNEDSFNVPMGNGVWRGKSIRYRPDLRAIVELEFVLDDSATRSQALRYFAKVYRDPEQAERACQMQKSLSEAIDETGQSLRVARPLPTPSHGNLLMTTAVAGVSLERTMKRGGDQEAHLRATARAIAALHRLKVPAPMRPADMEINQMRDSGDKLREVFPDLATQVGEIVEAVSPGLQGVTRSFVHGDMKPDHILVDSEDCDVSIIDFDLAATADPMLDIAHFVAFLGRSTSRSRAAETGKLDPIQLFLDEYFGHASHDGLARLPLYHAIAALHKATGLTRKPGPGSLEEAKAVLGEGMRYITGETVGSIAPSFKRRMTRTT